MIDFIIFCVFNLLNLINHYIIKAEDPKLERRQLGSIKKAQTYSQGYFLIFVKQVGE